MTHEELQILLEAATSGNRKAAEKFYHYLWKSEVYIPVKLNTAQEHNPSKNFVIVDYEQRQVLPIFFSEENFKNWSAQNFSYIKKKFKTLLWLVPDQTWLHFECGQEYGKEISPWELEQLKNDGINAFSDILDEILGANNSQVEVLPLLAEDENLKQELRLILEAYPDIKEGFLTRIKLVEEKTQRFVLGIKSETLTGEKLKQFTKEIEDFSYTKFENQTCLMLVSNLRWFLDAVPFYIYVP
ncbi:MAG: SseB family protein [Deltaproteobacteria bacterium]|jgi:hypothetical protein|nr:SseB family protein [Deltaproteobacteria bacterium]